MDDSALLRRYVEHHSDEAFAALVARHVNLVYSVARRQVGHPQNAEEITQAVFTILARKADGLRHERALSSWLFQATLLTAVNFVRSEIRRQHREQEAHMQSLLNESGEDPVWRQIVPLLDAAVGALSEKDRRAIVLRFYEGRNLREVGAALGVNEEAAKKRVARGLEKLQSYFYRRGVDSTAAAIGETMLANSVQAAPLALAKTVAAVAVTKGATASTSTLTLIKGALKIMAWTKVKTAIVIGAGVLLCAGTATVAIKKIVPRGPENWQAKYDPNGLDRFPPEVKILPSLPSTLQSDTDVAGVHDNRAAVGLGLSVSELLMIAYNASPSQLILDAPVPAGKYDFIANLPTWKANVNAMQEEIKKRFGLTAGSEMITTNVFVLTVQSPNAPGLRHAAMMEEFLLKYSSNQGPGSYSSRDESIGGLVNLLEENLGTMIIDKTGLHGNMDIDLKWDQTSEGLKQALLDQLGLAVTPRVQTVKFVVVTKAK